MRNQGFYTCLIICLLSLVQTPAKALASGAVGATSSITVTGTPGPSQIDAKLMVRIQPVIVDHQGQIAKGKIDSAKFPQYPVGQKVQLPPGKYYVSYSHNYNLVDLAAGEDKVIELKPLVVRFVDGNYKVNVFIDLTTPEEQDKELLFLWLMPQTLSFAFQSDDGNGHIKKWTDNISIEDFCKKASQLTPTGKQYCLALLGSTYKALASFYKFNNDASLLGYVQNLSEQNSTPKKYFQTGEDWTRANRIAVADGVDGDVLAVLPGTYGVEITNLEGKSAVIFDIKR